MKEGEEQEEDEAFFNYYFVVFSLLFRKVGECLGHIEKENPERGGRRYVWIGAEERKRLILQRKRRKMKKMKKKVEGKAEEKEEERMKGGKQLCVAETEKGATERAEKQQQKSRGTGEIIAFLSESNSECDADEKSKPEHIAHEKHQLHYAREKSKATE